MNAQRTLVSVPFESFIPHIKPSMAQTVDDLQSELRRTQAKLEGVEKDLTTERREHAMTKARLAHERVANRRMHDKHIPDGDADGYYCSVCNNPIYVPFEESYCSMCGSAFDWLTRNDQLDGDELAYDLAGDR